MRDLDQDFSGRQEWIKRKLRTYAYPQLKKQPFFGKNIKKLTNYKPQTLRYRIGNYRFFYETDEQRKIVFMTTADVRESAY